MVKTVRFADPKYVGDPINAVKIFNDKEVDELVVLDITASREGRRPNFEIVERLASEAFMPVAFGGGVQSVEDIRRLLQIGIEKVVLNTQALTNPQLVSAAAAEFGSQSVVVSLVKRRWLGRYEVYAHTTRRGTGLDPVEHARKVQELGAGEILLNAVDRDGTMEGYDLALIQRVTTAVSIPVVAIGGAGSLRDFAEAVNVGGASAVAAGSLFVFHGKHRAVLITYPDKDALVPCFVQPREHS